MPLELVEGDGRPLMLPPCGTGTAKRSSSFAPRLGSVDGYDVILNISRICTYRSR
jgi:hypothetical protein